MKKTLTDWESRFTGQSAVAVIELDTVKPDGIKMAVMAEITDADPEAVYNDLVTQLKLAENADKGDYNDVAYIQRKGDEGAVALVGKHLVLTNNIATLKLVIDSFLVRQERVLHVRKLHADQAVTGRESRRSSAGGSRRDHQDTREDAVAFSSAAR